MPPNSYKDPFWTNLAGEAAQEFNLPTGLLEGILLKGERSNADQVSSAGARTPFQIIEPTRQGIIKNYGFDPYATPRDSARGAAALLRESLDRNNGDATRAVQEYHGGTNPKNYGPINRDYVKRVMGGAVENIDSLVNEAKEWAKSQGQSKSEISSDSESIDSLAEEARAWAASRKPSSPVNMTPEELDRRDAQAPPEAAKKPSISDYLEAGAGVLTGATSGLAGGILGGLGAIPASLAGGNVVDNIMKGAQAGFKAGTYEPSTKQGRDLVERADEFVSQDLKIPAYVPALGTSAAISRTGRAATKAAEIAKTGQTTEELAKTAKKAADSIFKGSAKTDLAQSVKPDQKILDASKRLGVQGLLQPDQYSKSQEFRALSQAVKSNPVSTMAADETRNLNEIGTKAGNLIKELSGYEDLSAAELNVRGKLSGAESRLSAGIKRADEQIAKSGIESRPAKDLETQKALQSEISKRGGTEGLTAPEKKLAAIFSDSENSPAKKKEILGKANEEIESAYKKNLDDVSSKDITMVDEEVRGWMLGRIKELEDQADSKYDELRQMVPETTPAKSENVLGLILSNAKKRRDGVSDLSAVEKQIFNTLSPKTKKAEGPELVMPDGKPLSAPKKSYATYANLDDMRKMVGRELRGAGPFKDADTGLLKTLYESLSKDIESSVRSVGGDAFKKRQEANQTVIERKALEERAQGLFGKDLKNGIQPRLLEAVNALSRGNVEKANKVFDQIPEEARQDAFLSAVRQVAPDSKKFEALVSAMKSNSGSAKFIESVSPEFLGRSGSFSKSKAGITAKSIQQAEQVRARTVANLTDSRKEFVSEYKKTTDPTTKARLAKTIDAIDRDIRSSVGDKKTMDFINARQKAADALGKIQENQTKLFGSNLEKSLDQTMASALSSLSSKDSFQNFGQTIKAIPKSIRRDVVVNSLLKTFGKPTKHGDLNFNDYTKWYGGIRKNNEAYKALSEAIGPQATQALQDLNTVSTGIRNATREYIGTGKLGSMQKILDNADSTVGRLIEVARKAAVVVPVESASAALGLPPGIGIAAALIRPRPDTLSQLDKIMRGEEFQKAVAQTMANGPKSEPGKHLESLSKSKEFIDFAKKTGVPFKAPELQNWMFQSSSAFQQNEKEAKK